MKGHPKVIEAMNKILCNELTALNQYILHSRMLDNWGVKGLGKKEYDASIDEMKHADELMKRILFLEGLPNLQKLNKIRVGQDVKEVLECDLKLEHEAIQPLKDSIKLCEDLQDYVSRDLFKDILASEEEHIDWLEEQVDLVKQVGLENYIQSQM